MTALFAIATFFFIFVLVYVAVSVSLVLVGWWMARPVVRARDAVRLREIEQRIDRAKEKAFIVSIVLTFFCVTPFVVIYLFILP
jgi:hypothetical protein